MLRGFQDSGVVRSLVWDLGASELRSFEQTSHHAMPASALLHRPTDWVECVLEASGGLAAVAMQKFSTGSRHAQHMTLSEPSFPASTRLHLHEKG